MFEHFGHHGQGWRIVYPRLLWLDVNRQPIGETTAEPRSLPSTQAGGWALRFQRPLGARYALLFSDRSRLGQTLIVDHATLPDVLVAPGLPVPITLGQHGDIRRIAYVATSTGTVRHLQLRRVELVTEPDGRRVQVVRSISPEDLPPREMQPATVQWGRLR